VLNQSPGAVLIVHADEGDQEADSA
jgi:hypothetical protein